MNKIINKRQAICGTVWIVIFCIVIALWPLRLINETVVSGSNRQISMQSEAIRDDYTVMQMFIAQYDHLQNIRVYLLNESAGEEFCFILYDASLNILMNQVISTDEMEEMPGFCTIQVNQDTEVGREYYYLIQGISTDFYVAYEDTETSGTIYNGTLYYGNVEDTEHNIISEYEYRVPFRKGKTLVCDVLLVLFGFITYILSGKYYEKHPNRNSLLTVETVWKRVANPVVAVAAFVCVIAVFPGKLFSQYAENNLFFIAGVLITAGILFYGINHTRTNKSCDMGLSFLRDHLTDYLQAAFFALAIQSGVHYMNGLYEIHHMIASREMLIYFGLAVIMTYKREEIFHPVNLIYLALAALVGSIYYQNHVETLKSVEEIQVLKLTVWVGVIAGIVILNTIWILARGQLRRSAGRHYSLWYGVVLMVFFALLVIFRNTRGWPVYLVCSFGLYYLRMAVWDKKERMLQNICNGILLHFLVMTGYCLLHRPYMFFIYYRYPFIFHTVTVSAVYLSLVVCAAFVKLLDRYCREAKLSSVWKELTVFGISMVYLILTLSRTGYLAIIVMGLIVVPFACLNARKQIKFLLQTVVMMFAIVILCFPAVFTAQRLIPAVVAQPETLEIEELPDEIVHGREMDSKYYMTIRRFIQVFEMKVFGMPEEKCIYPYSYPIAKDDKQDAGKYAAVDKMLVASTAVSGKTVSDETGMEKAEEQLESAVQSYANGRMEIFKQYYDNLNLAGHDDMYIVQPDGSLLAHAHNIYLQTAYDFGIPIGIVFILFGFCTLIQAAVYFIKRKNDRPCAILPLALLILFAVAGLTEWIFYPCQPITFCLLLTLAPLLVDDTGSRKRNA